MIEKTKIALSSKELELVCNKEWILTKQIIIEKVYQLFGALASSMEKEVIKCQDLLPAEFTDQRPKISRGENYKNLPYVMLDYPRYFTKESTLAIRTFFWWGNFFSINLHLSGTCKEKAIPSLEANFKELQRKDYSLCIGEGPWHHHFGEENYMPLNCYSSMEFAAMLNSKPFIKIAKKISLLHWDAVPDFIDNHFSEMIKILRANSPGDEINLSPGIPITGFDL